MRFRSGEHGNHVHILQAENLGIRLVVLNDKTDLRWDKWFDKNPDAKVKIQVILQKLLPKDIKKWF